MAYIPKWGFWCTEAHVLLIPERLSYSLSYKKKLVFYDWGSAVVEVFFLLVKRLGDARCVGVAMS